jgi:hypothetical protein
MKAMLLRVGINKGNDGILSPVYQTETLNTYHYQNLMINQVRYEPTTNL